MSMGVGGSIIGVLYAMVDYIIKNLKQKFISTISLQERDPTYRWVRKYIKEEKLI